MFVMGLRWNCEVSQTRTRYKLQLFQKSDENRRIHELVSDLASTWQGGRCGGDFHEGIKISFYNPN